MTVTVKVFGSKFDGIDLDWHMAESPDGNRVWIERVEVVNSEMNPYGSSKNFIDLGIFNNKPIDYTEQVSSLVGNEFMDDADQFIAASYPVSDIYTDITGTLNQLLPIKEYRANRPYNP